MNKQTNLINLKGNVVTCNNEYNLANPFQTNVFNIRVIYPGQKKSIYWPTENKSFINDLEKYFPKITSLYSIFNNDSFIIYRCVTQLSLNAYSIILQLPNIDILIQFIQDVMWVHIKNGVNNKKLIWKYYKMSKNYTINIPDFGTINILSLLTPFNINFDDVNYKIDCHQNIIWHNDAGLIMSDKVKWDIKNLKISKKKIKKLIKQNKSSMIGLIYINLDKTPQWIQLIPNINIIIFTHYNPTSNKYVINEVSTMLNLKKVYLWSAFYNISQNTKINPKKYCITLPNISIFEKSKYITTISRTIYFKPQLIKFDRILQNTPIYPNSNSILSTLSNPNVWRSNPIFK